MFFFSRLISYLEETKEKKNGTKKPLKHVTNDTKKGFTFGKQSRETTKQEIKRTKLKHTNVKRTWTKQTERNGINGLNSQFS